MFYLSYKSRIKKMWKSVSVSDRKIKDNETKPEGVIKKEFEIPLRSTGKVKFKSKTLKFNLYYDEKEILRPVILDIHGGGWAYGDKDLNDNFCYHLAKEGFNVISLSYTLAFKAKMINQIQEIDYLVNYLFENKDKYFLDFNNFFVTGDSAGGQLTYLYSLIISNNEIFKDIYKVYNTNNLKINAIAINHGAPYLKGEKLGPTSTRFQKCVYKTCRLTMVYGHFYKFKKVYGATDPDETLRYVTHYVPAIIVTSKGDNLCVQSAMLDQEMTMKHFPHEYVFYDDEKVTHVYNVLFPASPEGKIINSKIINYFKNHLN